MLLSRNENKERVEVKHHKIKKHENGHIRCEEEYGKRTSGQR
jgi:hypothetical protein